MNSWRNRLLALLRPLEIDITPLSSPHPIVQLWRWSPLTGWRLVRTEGRTWTNFLA